MTTSGGINFEDGDIDPDLDLDAKSDLEGSFEDLPPESTDFDTFEFDNIVEAPSDSPVVITKEDLDELEDNLEKIVDRELKKIQKEANKEASDLKKTTGKEDRREIQDEKRSIRRAKKSLTTNATRRRTDIRTDASDAKRAIYSLSAALGLPGYVIANVVDHLYIDPLADKDIKAEQSYTDQLNQYFNNVEDEVIEKQRELEDNRDEIAPATIYRPDVKDFVTSKGQRPDTSPIQPTNKKESDKIRYYHGTVFKDASAFSGKTYVTPSEDYAKNYGTGNKNTLYTDFTKDEAINRGLYDEVNNFPINGSIEDGKDVLKNIDTTNVKVNNTSTTTNPLPPPVNPTNNNPNPLPPPNNNPPNNPNNPPNNNPPNNNPVPPIIPNRNFNPAIIPKIAIPVAAVIKGAQIATREVQQLGDRGKETIGNFFDKSPIDNVASNIDNITKSIDPLGVNVGGEIFNQAVQVFAKTVDSFGTYADKDKGFSPETLQVSVEGSINKLMQSIELAQQTDPNKAAVKEQLQTLDLIWSDFKAKVFNDLAPIIIGLLKQIVALMITIKAIIDAIKVVLYLLAGNMPVIGSFLRKMLNNMTKPANPLTGKLAQELAEFHDTKNQPTSVAKAINRR